MMPTVIRINQMSDTSGRYSIVIHFSRIRVFILFYFSR